MNFIYKIDRPPILMACQPILACHYEITISRSSKRDFRRWLNVSNRFFRERCDIVPPIDLTPNGYPNIILRIHRELSSCRAIIQFVLETGCGAFCITS